MNLVLYWPEIFARQHLNDFPYHIAYLGSILKNEGYNLDYVITNLSAIGDNVLRSDALGDWYVDKDVKNIINKSVDVLLVSSWFINLPFAIEVIKKVKKIRPELKIIMGGYPASTIPEQLLSVCPDIDFLIVGEGEESMINLLKNMSSGVESKNSDLSGIAFLNSSNEFILHNNKDNNNICTSGCNPFRNFVLPDFDSILKIKNYNTLGVEFSRGCTYNSCNFCTSQKYSKFNELPIHDAKKVIQHIGSIWCGKYVSVHDNHFLYDLDRVFELSSEFKNYNIDWSCFSRIDINPEIIDIIVKNNCKNLFLGLESLDEQNLLKFKKASDVKSYVDNAHNVIDRLMEITKEYPDFDVNFSLLESDLSSAEDVLSEKQFEFLKKHSPHINAKILAIPNNPKFLKNPQEFVFDFRDNFFYKKYLPIFRELFLK